MPCAKCIQFPAKAKTVTVLKGPKGDAGAVFDLAPKVGSVSDKRAANGGVTVCVKKAQTNNVNEARNGEWKMGARGRDGLTSARRVRRGPSPGWVAGQALGRWLARLAEVKLMLEAW